MGITSDSTHNIKPEITTGSGMISPQTKLRFIHVFTRSYNNETVEKRIWCPQKLICGLYSFICIVFIREFEKQSVIRKGATFVRCHMKFYFNIESKDEKYILINIRIGGDSSVGIEIGYGLRQGREADHSPPTSAEVNKIWIYTSTPLCVFMA
jgi:hypothetical protein